ncbi:methyltransferase domain-containing protein [Streptomyces sp. NPDC057702]|uniref:methyltransferase domain-containing protein n=1 Tax=unclassified Streptomyces TaxID=2593676 RepID=UPI0036A65A71
MKTELTSSAELRHQMTERLASQGALRSDAWRSAFADVPREGFVPHQFTVGAGGHKHSYTPNDPAWLPVVYSDAALLTQFDASGTATSSSTQPWLMAHMLEDLDVEPGHRVLEVGLGTGYNCALLTHRLGHVNVFSIDIDPDLVTVAAGRLRDLGYAPTVAVGDGRQGLPAHAPYDRLLATCGIARVTAAWRAQLRPGGVIVVNIGLGIARLVVGEDRSVSGRFRPYLGAFTAARAAPDAVAATARQLTRRLATARGHRRSVQVTANLASEGPRFLGSLVQPDVVSFSFTDPDGHQVHCLHDPATESWARITLLDVRAARLDHGGPRDLWAEREPLINRWVSHGRPAPGHYGLTVSPAGDHTLWLDSPSGYSWPLPDA